MPLKKLFLLLFIAVSVIAIAEEPVGKFKFYGYVGNEFFYNSRQNMDLVDGAILLFPKPTSINSARVDVSATPQAEMLSVNSRLGIDINGAPILGAKSTGKIEADFAGTGPTYFILRLRQAFVKLNWNKTELLLGQTWHPLFGNVAPTTPSSNGGAPFQPFNRSPQLRIKQSLTKTLSVTAAALYEMQYASQGPLTATTTGASSIFMKNAIAPDLFVGLENKTSHWITGAGIDYKTLKPDAAYSATISSLSAVAYTQYTNNKLQLKAKLTYGENLSDQLMLGGYSVSKYGADSATVLSYTNFKNMNGWLNIVYGSKFQVGLLLGASENLGASDNLAVNKSKKFTTYGYGFYENSVLDGTLKKGDAGYLDQQILDKLYRIAPHVSYNLPNLKFALEYDFTTASYGKLEADGTAGDSYIVANNRILASVSYIF